MKLFFDLDGVIRDLHVGLEKIYKEKYPDHWTKAITSWGLAPFFQIGDGIYKFFSLDYALEIAKASPPFRNSVQVLEKLKKRHQIYVITYQPTKPMKEGAFWWVSKYIPFIDGIIFEKKEKKTDWTFDLLIDDYAPTVQKAINLNRRAYVLNRPWNVHYDLPRIFKLEELFEIVGLIDV